MNAKLKSALEGDAPDEVVDIADETPDASDTPTTDEQATADASEDKSTDPAEAEPVELPKDEYAVDQFAKLLEEHDMDLARQENVLTKNHYVANTVGDLARALESLQVGGDAVLPSVLANESVRSGHLYANQVALEAFDVQSAAKAIVDTIKKLIKQVLEAIAKAIEWVQQKLRDMTSMDRFIMNTVTQATDAFLLVRKQESSKLAIALKKNAFDPASYVNMAQYKLWLTVDGKEASAEPKGLTREFNRVLNLVGSQNYFASQEAMGAADVLSEMIGLVKEGAKLPVITKQIDPLKAVPAGSTEYSHFDGYTPEADRKFMAYGPLMGNVSLCNEFPRHGQATEALTGLNNLAMWRLTLRQSPSAMVNGTMRMLSTEEVLGVNRVIAQLGEELDRRRRNLQIYQRMVEKLRKVVREASVAIEANDEVDPLRYYTYSKIVQAANALIKNGMCAVDNTTLYARKVLTAWGFYLAQTTKKDISVAASVQ